MIRVIDYKWNMNKAGYTVSNKIYLHRLLLTFTKDDPMVDHEDRDKTNNTLVNLREADPITNNQNKGLQSNNASGFTGVSYMKNKDRFRAYYKIQGIQKGLGSYATLDEAIIARLIGEVVYLNEGFQAQRNLFENYLGKDYLDLKEELKNVKLKSIVDRLYKIRKAKEKSIN